MLGSLSPLHHGVFMRFLKPALWLLVPLFAFALLRLFAAPWVADYRAAVAAEDHLAAGVVALAEDDLSRATEEFHLAHSLQPRSAHLLGRIGLAYYVSGHWQQAIPWLRRAIRLDPDNPSLLNNLGYLYAEHGINLDESIRLLRRAVNLAPRDGMILDSLGWAYYQKGEWSQALPLLEEAADLAHDAEIHYHLAVLYRRLGRREEALEQLRQTLKLNPRHAKAAEEYRSLRQGK